MFTDTGLGLLSLFVCICSFIPIAGVFISTIPIAFVALTEFGFMKVRAVLAIAAGGAVCRCACVMRNVQSAVLFTKLDSLAHTTVTVQSQLALVIAMVTGIHFVEAYGLNPGAH